jgi:N-dimethylarginine dimethylaminohydrolase
MRSLILDLPNGRELANELDLATEQMMSIPVELIGSAHWLTASDRQQQAFQEWREYLQLMADGRVRVEALRVA